MKRYGFKIYYINNRVRKSEGFRTREEAKAKAINEFCDELLVGAYSYTVYDYYI